MRGLTIGGLQAIFAQSTGDVIVPAIRLKHPSLGETEIKLVSNVTEENLVGLLTDYQIFPLQIVLAPDIEENAPQAQIIIDNISRELIDELRSWESAPTITIELFRITPNNEITLEVIVEDFELKNIKYDATTITGTLSFERDILNEAATKDRFTPNVAPGLF